MKRFLLFLFGGEIYSIEHQLMGSYDSIPELAAALAAASEEAFDGDSEDRLIRNLEATWIEIIDLSREGDPTVYHSRWFDRTEQVFYDLGQLAMTESVDRVHGPKV